MNIAFLIPIVMIFASYRQKVDGRALLFSTLVILGMTTVFDNYIIGSGIVAYDSANISGIKLGLAPVEDFAYSIAALLALPILWELLSKTKEIDAR